jgi:dipeptidyl-peptidase-3
MGNYKGFGDSKFVPDLKPEQFKTIIKKSKAWSDNPNEMQEIWDSCKNAIWLVLLKMAFSFNCCR